MCQCGGWQDIREYITNVLEGKRNGGWSDFSMQSSEKSFSRRTCASVSGSFLSTAVVPNKSIRLLMCLKPMLCASCDWKIRSLVYISEVIVC